MRKIKVLAAVCGLAALLCGCDKSDPIQVSEVSLNANELSLVPGETRRLTATVSPDNAEYDAVVWSSSDNGIASVTEDGTVTAVAAGEAVITATAGEKKADCKVTVTIPVTGITLDKEELALTIGGEAVKLTATVTPEDATNKSVSWTSEDPTVATVAEDGTVTPVAAGTTKVTAEASGFKAECTVTIAAPAKKWEIGEYYDVDGVKGVVVWVSENKEHGKIVSLDETATLWSKGTTNTGAKSEDDGKANTEKVQDLNSTLEFYPAFKWCVDHGKGWYFPAISEVYLFMNAKSAIDPTLKANGGMAITDYYWSSTEGEEDETAALYAYFSNGKVSGYSDFKDDPEGDTYARAMYEF